MKNLLILACFFIFCSAPLFAQWENIAFVSAYKGVSLPLGNLKSVSISDNQSGYAKSGSTIGIEGGYIINHWGIIAKVAEYQCPYNTDALHNNLLSQGKSYNLSSGQWVSAMYSLGVCGVLPVTNYFCIRGSLYGGLQNTVAPPINDLTSGKAVIDRNAAWGLYKGASLALQFRVGHFSIAPEASIESSQARVNDISNKTVTIPVNTACVMGALVFYLGELNSLHEHQEFSE